MPKPLLPLAVLAFLALAGCSSSQQTTTPTTDAPTTSTVVSNTEATVPLAAESTTTISPTAVAIRVTHGTVEPAPTRREFTKGETVQIVVTSDVPEEIHVHGYDKSVKLEPGVTSTLGFVADIPGVFEVELEHSGKHLFELAVAG